MTSFLIDDPVGTVEIIAVAPADFSAWVAARDDAERQWLAATGFTGRPGQTALVPDREGRLSHVVHAVGPGEPAIWALAGLPKSLPEGRYRLGFDADRQFGGGAATAIALGWALGSYQFTRYKRAERTPARLLWPDGADQIEVTALHDGIALARDLVTTSAEQMGPAELAAAAAEMAASHGARCVITEGEALLAENYPAIHIVGRASARAPRLIDIVWGPEDAPKVTLVGKGVCFDTGGLDLKTAAGMRMMKKDMGGGATLLGLAHAVMASNWAVRLRVLVPAVENSVSGNAFRPGDVIATRKGISVEIGNTDAEGRLVLGDALTAAMEDKPGLVIDMATLTGAARTALGPELPAMFANDEDVAAELTAAAATTHDPLWRMPLWRPYRKMLDSPVADIVNSSESGFAGAVTAALYLQEFVEPDVPWVHIDTYAWNGTTRPGRPEGGEALCLRALHAMLKRRLG